MSDTRSEDTLIFNGLTPGVTDFALVYDALKEFLEKKQTMDHSDRFNVILFQEDGPNYLEEFTLNPDNVLIAMKSLEPMLARANVAGGIMVAITFIIDVFKKISDKCFRLIILTDEGSYKIPEQYVPVLENLIDQVKDMPFIIDIIRVKVNDPVEDLKLLDLVRRTSGNLHEIFEVRDLPSILDKLAEKRSFSSFSLYDDDISTEIKYENYPFFENLAADPILLHATGTCSICFKQSDKDLVQCPSCETIAHKSCWAQWAKTSNIGIFNLFRCHNCFNLIKLEKDYVQMVHSGQVPSIEEIHVEVVDLQEFQESLETTEGPKIISVEDPMAIFYRGLDDDLIVVKDDD